MGIIELVWNNAVYKIVKGGSPNFQRKGDIAVAISNIAEVLFKEICDIAKFPLKEICDIAKFLLKRAELKRWHSKII